jgi:lysozyme
VVDDDSPAGLDQMLIDLLAGFVNKVRSFVFCYNNVACNELLMIRRIIDISHHEDPIDFEKVVANGIVAIIAKATQGATGVDPAYAKFKRAAAPYKFLWGSYHFGTGANVKAQVEHYLATVKPTDNELVCLDFEQNPSGSSIILPTAREFISLVEQEIGRYPVLYGGGWLKEQLNGKGDDVLSKCPLWISHYASKPVLPPGWKKYVLWQYTDGHVGEEPHNVSGIGPCDHSQYNGTITGLRKRWPFGGK